MANKILKNTWRLAALTAYVLAPGIRKKEQAEPFLNRSFAHRGLHTVDMSVPENTLAAFEEACRAGYGMELDVQLSKDGQVVVFHDDDLYRVCGVNARVDSMTYEELKQLSVCGSEEKIPLFSQVLELVNARQPLIVELKTTPRRKELCEKTYELLRNYPGEYCIESFDSFMVRWFRIHASEVFRGQLSSRDLGPSSSTLIKVLKFMVRNCMMNFLCRPQFIAYEIGDYPFPVQLVHMMGAVKVGWTGRQPGCEEGLDAVIFEYYRPETRIR
ncbi:MAG: glycerophosphodiester phosphodiesterase [Lachnospiraceae bacterium]|nr:glycerophosphodiester phosphodiesterase [Lachnospiraceae bacterium]